MRIAFYHKSAWPKYKGAIFTRVHQLAREQNVDVSFTHVAETDEVRLALGGVDLSYHHYPFRVLFQGSYEDASTLQRIHRLTRDVIAHPCNLVVLPGYDRPECWTMLLACMLLRRKRAVFCDSTRHDNPPVRWKTWAKRAFFACCHGFVGYGERTKEYLISLGAHERDVVVPCVAAALPHDYDSVGVLERYQRQAPDVRQPLKFLYVGRLAEEKGLFDLLDAFAAVRIELPEARLELVGEGGLRRDLEGRLRELELEQAVTLRGAMPLHEVAELYYSSAALVLPSHREPWGLVANEALSYGCPVVISDRCGCTPELLIDGATGFGFAARSVAALRQAMLDVIRLSDDRPATARRCVEVAHRLTPERAARRMLEGCIGLALH